MAIGRIWNESAVTMDAAQIVYKPREDGAGCSRWNYVVALMEGSRIDPTRVPKPGVVPWREETRRRDGRRQHGDRTRWAERLWRRDRENRGWGEFLEFG